MTDTMREPDFVHVSSASRYNHNTTGRPIPRDRRPTHEVTLLLVEQVLWGWNDGMWSNGNPPDPVRYTGFVVEHDCPSTIDLIETLRGRIGLWLKSAEGKRFVEELAADGGLPDFGWETCLSQIPQEVWTRDAVNDEHRAALARQFPNGDYGSRIYRVKHFKNEVGILSGDDNLMPYEPPPPPEPETDDDA